MHIIFWDVHNASYLGEKLGDAVQMNQSTSQPDDDRQFICRKSDMADSFSWDFHSGCLVVIIGGIHFAILKGRSQR